MNRRGQDYGRRSHKRSRSPDDRETPREDKRRRPYEDEKVRERSYSPRTTRATTNGRDERSERREERRDRDSRRDGGLRALKSVLIIR